MSYPYAFISVDLNFSSVLQTFTGFLRKIKKASALCVKNLVNLCTRMCSISSACLILMLTRMLLMLGSIKTRSFSFLATVSGLRRTSGDVCASISGTLCRSEVWDAKFDKHNADVKDDRTHCKYGRRDWDCVYISIALFQQMR
jgi:hypothetical protein